MSGADGVFAYGASSVFPNSGFNGSNYWVDVAFNPSATLTSIAVTPANPAIASARHNNSLQLALTVTVQLPNITTQVTWSSSNTAVATHQYLWFGHRHRGWKLHH